MGKAEEGGLQLRQGQQRKQLQREVMIWCGYGLGSGIGSRTRNHREWLENEADFHSHLGKSVSILGRQDSRPFDS